MISAIEARKIILEKEVEHQEHIKQKRERLLADIERRIKEAAEGRKNEVTHRIPNTLVTEFETLLKEQGFSVSKNYVRDAKHCDLTMKW